MPQALITGVESAGVAPYETVPDLPRPETPEEAAKLPAGTEFLNPKGERQVVPYRPKNITEVDALPEGAHFLDPQGTMRTKPKSEGLDFTAQTLYDMAVTDEERKKALERSYPGKVKKNERTNQFYVDDDGTLRRPKGFTEAPGAFLASQAAPVIGSIGGEILGGVAGTGVAPGPGTFGGAVAGGAVGGAAGQAFNDAIMALAGVYDRTPMREAGEVGLSGALGGVGTAAGRGLAAAAPVVKGAVSNALPKAFREFLGVNPEGLETKLSLLDKGVRSGVSKVFEEAPAIQNIVEVYDPHFRTQNPLLQSATEHYEKSAKSLLESPEIGAKGVENLSKPEAAVSTEKAGEAVLGRTREELRKADEELRIALEQRRTGLTAEVEQKGAAQQSHMAELERAATEARNKAQAVIDEGFKGIDKSVTAAMETAKAGHNSGDLWWSVAQKLRIARAGIAARANKMYGEADELAGGLKPDVSGLSDRAQAFLEQLPEGFEGRYPAIVKQLRDMAGVQNEAGEFTKAPVTPTWAQLHNLRSVMRMNYNSFDLTPDIKQGTFKFFAAHVDAILNDEAAVPELQAAAKQLREADNFYRDNMGPLNDKRIQSVMDGLESGLPADPKILFDTIVKEGRTDLTKHVSELVGPTLWAGVKAADVREMLDQSRGLVPGTIDGRRFVSQVMERYRNGMLEAVHGKDVSAQLLRQAQNIEELNGRLPVTIRPGDKISDVLSKARTAADAVKDAAKKDPLGTLNREIKGIEKQLAASNRLAAKNLGSKSSLGFLYDQTTGASEAVNRILSHEDLIIAAESKFGKNSPEFNLLRQVWAERLLTGTLEPGQKLAKVSEEVQQIMFPGVSLTQAKTLAKEMDFLLSGRVRETATSMAAQARINNPWGHLVGESGPVVEVVGALKFVGGNPLGRFLLGKYYKMVTALANRPGFLRWLQKGLDGDEQARAMVRAEVQRRMKIGGPVGAGVSQALGQTIGQETNQ